MAMITEIEDYFTKGCGRCERFDTPDCSTRQWIDGLNHLREICQDMGESYVINLNSAKKSETRVARILKFRGKIIAGKGAMKR